MSGTGVAITNPLVLYRSLLATQKIRPDPAQHRLALHLQKLYDNLIDYEPSVEYSQRLQQLSRAVDTGQNATPPPPADLQSRSIRTKGLWNSLLAQKKSRDTVELTRRLTDQDEAMKLQSPKGLMLHGEVGTGKSMLIDLFQDCLPNRKKRRWHFNTFMLDTTARLEQIRRSRAMIVGPDAPHDENSLLLVARDLIETSPILFLDEFQLPDRAASKILSNLMTSFFQLGGVLIATSNRMPEDLAKAAGMEFDAPRTGKLGWSLGGRGGMSRRDEGAGQKGEFAAFLEVLRARCEVWEMEGKKDYRKLEREDESQGAGAIQTRATESNATATFGVGSGALPIDSKSSEDSQLASQSFLPMNYLVQPSTAEDLTTFAETFNTLVERATQTAYPIPWEPTTIIVYGRPIDIPAQHNGVAFFTFSELCGAVLGPADYITLASTYHTFILTDVPIMQFLQKNEARRLITLLDALYEARCRLLITAVTGPDDIFFPEPPASTATGEDALLNDAVYPETYSEIYQDATSPFRPNVSSYGSDTLAPDALEDDPPNRARTPGSSFTDERRLSDGSKAPDFANIGGLTGEDERFAVKRAESRIWEMCSGRWWDRAEWWRPLPITSRHWERSSVASQPARASLPPNVKILSQDEQQGQLFPHGASPFRTHPDAPPKIDWTHVWGTVKWGRRAGAWGKGVEGLEERKGVGDGKGERDGDGGRDK
ncbi:mitochondrial ATPase-like protein [Ophiobolus disseminans]|uniref:Mitochondrial ATPase-like protein n=1 Tax=Ophiobolus disseminans TaxID=1469910 RepID=A0A6A7AKM3_9PLEO|nr:mitochondrial ATPase-like protein [Ophiobolus disseminans]